MACDNGEENCILISSAQVRQMVCWLGKRTGGVTIFADDKIVFVDENGDLDDENDLDELQREPAG
jgi:hypothetical protein